MWCAHTYFYTFNQPCLATVIVNTQVAEQAKQASSTGASRFKGMDFALLTTCIEFMLQYSLHYKVRDYCTLVYYDFHLCI